MDAKSTASKQKNKPHQVSVIYEDQDDVSWLLENLLVSSINDAQNQPFSIFLYRIGMMLYEECYKTNNDQDGVQHVEQVLQKWLDSLPKSIIETTVLEIIEAFITLVTNSIQSPSTKMLALQVLVLDALFSLCGLFSSSFIVCKIVNDYRNLASATEFYIALHKLYLKLQTTDLMQDPPFKHQVMTAIQRMISALLLVKVQRILMQRQVENEQEKEENTCFLHILVELSTCDQDGLSLLLQDAINSEIVITCCPAYTYSGPGVRTCPVKTLREGLENFLHKLSSTDFFGDSEQYVYLLTVLLDSQASDFTEQVQYSMMEKKINSVGLPRTTSTKTDVLSSSLSRKGSKIAKKATSSTIDLYIDQIKQIMPHLGDGYIELALECYGWDVETVLSKLLDSPNEALHPRLQSCSASMPRWKKQQQEEDSINPSEEAKKIQLQHLKALEDQQELDAYILKRIDGENEYDDDYDDQYDDVVGAGDVSGPSTMMDDTYFDQIRRYNAVKRSEENEEKFWNDIRNVNRPKQNNYDNAGDENSSDSHSIDNSSNQKRWGPNKGKGGRPIGPDGKYLLTNSKLINSSVSKESPNGGINLSKEEIQRTERSKKDTNVKTDQSTTVPKALGEQLTKIQKRRKNDNKAKVANHHRKERAQKKTSGL